MKKSIIIIFAIIISTQVHARRCVRNCDRDCVKEFVTLQREVKSLSPVCEQNKDLKLKYTYQYYSNLRDNPYKVRYWQGGYTRNIITTSYYLRELVNKCQGSIISSDVIEKRSEQEVYFNVFNPNLDSEISQSYMLVPITEEEATEDMARILEECEAFEI